MWVDVLRDVGDAARNAHRFDPGSALRPPGALAPDERFLEACTGCAECVPACPTDSIITFEISEGKTTPAIQPSQKPCYMCTELPCIAACPDGALLSPGSRGRVRMGIAKVDPKRCVTFRGSSCNLCFQACPFPNEAIMMVGGRPLVSSASCTGCGLCEYACPEAPKAISIIPERLLVPGLRVPRDEYLAG